MVDFIDAHRDELGVEPICQQLPIAPSTYHRHKLHERQPEARCDRVKRVSSYCWRYAEPR